MNTASRAAARGRQRGPSPRCVVPPLLLRCVVPPLLLPCVVLLLLPLSSTGCTGLRRAASPPDEAGAAIPAEPDLRAFRMAPPSRQRGAIRLVFRAPPLASRLAVVEACARAAGRPTAPGCAPLRSRLDATGQAHLRRFRATRARFLVARAVRSGPAAPAHPLAAALLPPAQLQAAEAFAEPFFRFATLSAVLDDLRLLEADRRNVVAAFRWFQTPLDAVCARIAQQRPASALAAVARWARLDDFLGMLARFYGVSARLPRRLSVDLVWSAPDRLRATAWAGRAVVPLHGTMFKPHGATATGFDRAALARTLGVVVHEFGHTFASLLPYARRRALTDRIAGEAGVLNRRHANIVDEAVQTAAGNVLFLRTLPDWTALDPVLYAYEPGQPWPAAIDRLARQLVPALAAHLATPSAFDGPFLDAALRRHVALFGRPPLAFSRACVLISDVPAATRWWRQLLPGLSRRALRPDGVARSERWLADNPWLTRWWMTLLPTTSPPARWLAQAKSAALKAAIACVRAGSAACFVARKRADAAGWDLALVASEPAGLRRLLGRLRHRRSLAALRLPHPVTAALTSRASLSDTSLSDTRR